MAQVIIEHPDGRQYGVSLETYFATYRAQGFTVKRQLHEADLAGALGDPEAVDEPDEEIDLPASAKAPGEPYATTIMPAPAPVATVSVPDDIDPATGAPR